jgi:hypothetical protein
MCNDTSVASQCIQSNVQPSPAEAVNVDDAGSTMQPRPIYVILHHHDTRTGAIGGTMKRHRLFACLVMASLTATGCVIAAASSAATNATPSGELKAPAFLDTAVARLDATHQITVDFSKDPAAAEAFLQKSTEALDGYTVNVIGIDVVPSATRAERDAHAPASISSGEVVPTETSWSCVTKATGTSRARAFRGCTHRQPTWTAVAAASPASAPDSRTGEGDLTAAMLASYQAAVTRLDVTPIPGAGFDVALDGSHATVNMRGTMPAPPIPGDIGQEITNWLTATAFSDASVDTIDFTFNGDCTNYGLATGGDACVGTIDRPHFAEMQSYEVVR